MGYESTIDAIRLGLSIQEMRSRVASMNVANANLPDARALRLDFSAAEAALRSDQEGRVGGTGDGEVDLAELAARLRGQTPHRSEEVIQVDREIGEMATSLVTYQSLAEALSRQFGLMRLAITGRS